MVEPGRRKLVRTYEVGYRDSLGKQRWKSTGPKLDDALDFRDSVLGRRRKGERVETTNATLAEVAEAWLVSQPSLLPVTREAYERMLRVHLLPRLGRRKVAVTEEDAARLVVDLREGRGPDGERRGPLAAWR